MERNDSSPQQRHTGSFAVDPQVVALHYGDPTREYEAAVRDAVVVDLSHRARIALEGPEAAMFLHNLCTNDIRSLPVGRSCEIFLTTAKAKIVSHGFVSRWRDDLLVLDVGTDSGETVIRHLDHYLISERLIIDDWTKRWNQFLVVGPKSTDLMNQLAIANLAPGECRQVTLEDDATIRVRRNDFLCMPGFELFVDADRAEAFWQRLLQASLQPAGDQVFEILRVEAGFPRMGIDLDESRFAMEAGRTAEAISYTKGCYLGQETIVMARDRGHVNRSLMGLRFEGDQVVPRGTRLEGQGTQAGEVTSCVRSPRFGVIGLGFVQRNWAKAGEVLEAKLNDGAVKVEVVTLPFTKQKG